MKRLFFCFLFTVMKQYNNKGVNRGKRQNLHFMDLRLTKEFGGGESNRNNINRVAAKKKREMRNHSATNLVDILKLINSNQDLIQDCLEKRGETILSNSELKKYGSLALSTAALECENKNEYRSFAKKRLENMMNKAIAEAHLILELQGKNCDNNLVGMEFASIEKTYC